MKRIKKDKPKTLNDLYKQKLPDVIAMIIAIIIASVMRFNDGIRWIIFIIAMISIGSFALKFFIILVKQKGNKTVEGDKEDGSEST